MTLSQQLMLHGIALHNITRRLRTNHWDVRRTLAGGVAALRVTPPQRARIESCAREILAEHIERKAQRTAA